MKSVEKNFCMLLLAFFLIGSYTASAQKNPGRMDKIKAIIDSKYYIFEANEVKPLKGMSRMLSSGEYELTLSGNELVSYLPYFGEMYVAPMNPDDASLKFTSRNFTYELHKHRKSWDVIISPTDVRDVRQLVLSILNNGYATLHVNSINRDPITFSGYVVERKDNRAL